MKKLSTDALNRISPEEFKATSKTPLVVVLDNVRSMNNVGSAFRTADAFLVEKIYLCGITAQPPHREIQKTALGATETVAWQYQPDAGALVQSLQQQGYVVVPIEQAQGSTPMHQFKPQPGKRYAYVFGNEVSGVSDAVMAAASQCIEIPQYGTKHSLNISVCMGIALYDFYQKCFLG